MGFELVGSGQLENRRNFAAGLLVISSHIFEQRRASCLTNLDLKEFF